MVFAFFLDKFSKISTKQGWSGTYHILYIFNSRSRSQFLKWPNQTNKLLVRCVWWLVREDCSQHFPYRSVNFSQQFFYQVLSQISTESLLQKVYALLPKCQSTVIILFPHKSSLIPFLSNSSLSIAGPSFYHFAILFYFLHQHIDPSILSFYFVLIWVYYTMYVTNLDIC